MGNRFVGPLPPAQGTKCQYIIVATDYLTKWAEAMVSAKSDAPTTTKFLYEHIFVRFGLPIEIVSDQGTHFINEVVRVLLHKPQIYLLKALMTTKLPLPRLLFL